LVDVVEDQSSHQDASTGSFKYSGINTMNKKTLNDSVLEIDQPKDWDLLPWPPLERLFSHLRTDGDCIDLSNLARARPHF
ncbi:hypothetical protein PMAYCL1PPCAC_00518, partial [Pristionchus mayeri]